MEPPVDQMTDMTLRSTAAQTNWICSGKALRKGRENKINSSNQKSNECVVITDGYDQDLSVPVLTLFICISISQKSCFDGIQMEQSSPSSQTTFWLHF